MLAAILVLKYDDVSFIIAVELAQNIVLVEVSLAGIGRDRNQRLLLLLKVLHHVLVHVDDARHDVLLLLLPH